MSEELSTEFEKLNSDILNTKVNIHKIKERISKAEDAAKQARANYDECIDEGDRTGADESLDKIADCRKEISAQQNELQQLRHVIETLYKRQQDLRPPVYRLQEKTSKACETAEAEKAQAAVYTGKLVATLDNINKTSEIL